MTRLVLDLNDLLFDQSRGADRIAAALFGAAVFAGIARDAQGVVACLAPALLLRARRVRR